MPTIARSLLTGSHYLCAGAERALLVMLLMWPWGYVKAAELETAPLASAQEILGTAASGSNYRVADPVASDGLLRIYSLQTSYGTFTTQGDAMLLQRRKELAALAALEAQSTSKAFGNAMAKAATAPIELAGDLVTKPVETVGRTISGIGEIFGRVASGVANVRRGRDDVASSALGISAAKRKIAAELGVDPYTDFAPLAKKLDEFARATAIGGLTVKIGFAFIPGAAGSAVSTSSTAHGLGKLVQDKTPAQLLDINRASLGRLGIPRDVAGRFLSNQNYTPADQTTIVSALQRLRGVKDLRLYVDRLAQANRRDLAVIPAYTD